MIIVWWSVSNKFTFRFWIPLSFDVLSLNGKIFNCCSLDFTGSYRIKTEFDLAMGQRGPDLAPSQNALPTLFTALQEQLGMKLESSTTMREVLVVDRLERPTEN